MWPPNNTFVKTILPKQWGLFISLIIWLVVARLIIISVVGVKLSFEILSHLHNSTNLHLGWIQKGFNGLCSLLTGQHVPPTLSPHYSETVMTAIKILHSSVKCKIHWKTRDKTEFQICIIVFLFLNRPSRVFFGFPLFLKIKTQRMDNDSNHK